MGIYTPLFFLGAMFLIMILGYRLNNLQKRVLQLEQKLEQALRNGTPGKKAPRTLERLGERRDRPNGG